MHDSMRVPGNDCIDGSWRKLGQQAAQFVFRAAEQRGARAKALRVGFLPDEVLSLGSALVAMNAEMSDRHDDIRSGRPESLGLGSRGQLGSLGSRGRVKSVSFAAGGVCRRQAKDADIQTTDAKEAP